MGNTLICLPSKSEMRSCLCIKHTTGASFLWGLFRLCPLAPAPHLRKARGPIMLRNANWKRNSKVIDLFYDINQALDDFCDSDGMRTCCEAGAVCLELLILPLMGLQWSLLKAQGVCVSHALTCAERDLGREWCDKVDGKKKKKVQIVWNHQSINQSFFGNLHESVSRVLRLPRWPGWLRISTDMSGIICLLLFLQISRC